MNLAVSYLKLFYKSLLISKSKVRDKALLLERLVVDDYNFLGLLVWLNGSLMPDSFLFAKQCLFLTVLGPVHGQHFTKELAFLHIEYSMFTVFNIFILDQTEVASDWDFWLHALLGGLSCRHHYLIYLTKGNEGGSNRLFICTLWEVSNIDHVS